MENSNITDLACFPGSRCTELLHSNWIQRIRPILNVENEPRILQIATPKSEKPILIANTHLAATADWSMSAVRRLQVVDIANILRPCAKSEIVILCGDFNAAPASSDLAELREVLPYIYSSEVATYVKELSAHRSISFFVQHHSNRTYPFILRAACRITISSLRRLTGHYD